MPKQETDSFFIISRPDHPGRGFRQGLLHLVEDVAEHRKPGLIIINGGLSSHRALRDEIKAATEVAIEEQKEQKEFMKSLPKHERTSVPTQAEVRAETRLITLQKAAQELANALPVITGKNGRPVKYYITTSKAHNYDGPLGQEVAELLQTIRDDVIYWDRESSRFKAQHAVTVDDIAKVLWALNPTKGSWRSEYYTSSAQRIVSDKVKQTSQDLPDIWTVGTGASAINKPAGGEISRPMITIPALHRLQEIHTSENQVGLAVVELASDRETPVVDIYNFKDLVARERDFIRVPREFTDEEGLTKAESDRRARMRAIFDRVVKDIPTIGMLDDALKWKRSTIEYDIRHYNEQGFEPAIVLDEKSGKYNVSYDYLRRKLRYPKPNLDNLVEDSSISFSCLHAGYKTTQYSWFLKRAVEVILEEDIQSIVGCGDFIAGLKHNLDFRGELLPGANNYDIQEEFAARLIAAVMVRVFKKRFDACLARKRKTPDKKKLRNMVLEALIDFYYTLGNHDAWVEDHGHTTLAKFNEVLRTYIVSGVQDYLAEHDFALPGVRNLVEERVHYGGEHAFPSGVTMSIRHPRQGRMKTFSGRAQQTLASTKGQVVYIGNFHVACAVHEWHPDLGQRLAVQEGTIAAGTDFETNMNKLVDTEFGITRVYSDPKTKRIFQTRIQWESPKKEDIVMYRDEVTIKQIMEELNI